jgi:medium-chain acyl-[acyl-carrier-protein] hydrolase
MTTMNVSTGIPPDEKALTLFLPFHVTSADADMNSRLRPGSLVNLLIQSAINSADALGFGLQLLRNQNLFWVLSRLSVEIYKPLCWYQSGVVETWPKNLDKILYVRDFLVRDQNQEVVARATSGWLAVDTESKRPKTFDAIHAPVFTRLKDKHALSTSPEKLFPVKDGEVFEVKTGYFDIDLNGHVTSTRYIDWMMDTFTVEFHQKNYPSKLSINFLHETKPGETISLVRTSPDEKSFTFEGFNKTSNTFAFRGYVEF